MKSILTAALITLVATTAQAGVVLSDNFDAENGGVTQTNYSSFTNWSVNGQVDLVHMPNGFGITCSGGCVDLDGSSGPGRLVSDQFGVNAGDLVTVSFDVSGNQRSQTGGDIFYAGFGYSAAVNPLDIALSPNLGGSPVINPANFSTGAFRLWNAGFNTFSMSFRAGGSGDIAFFIGSPSADNVGPLLDNVSLSISAVPEPATWLTMIAGFGMIGAALRQRKGAASVA